MQGSYAPLYNGKQLEIDQVTGRVTVHIRCGWAMPQTIRPHPGDSDLINTTTSADVMAAILDAI